MPESHSETQLRFPPFKSRWWALNTHIHTIVPSQFMPVKPVSVQRVEIDTPDDDFLELDILDTGTNKPVVALFHGLEGSSKRFYIRNLMSDLESAGFSSVAMNFRGCGSRLNNQKRFYHSGETSDYHLLFNWMKDRFPDREVYAVGFSLGANALIKSLSELEGDPIIKKAVAVSPPYDLGAGSINMSKGFNKIYEYRFIHTLKEKANRKRAVYPDIPEFTGKTIYEFDDMVTAPVHGFESADHYYNSCSSKNFLKDVRTPLLIIHSKKDTLCPLEFAPFSDIDNNPFIQTIFTNEGGHVGFVSSPGNWLNRSILTWVDSPNDLYLSIV